MTVLYIFLIPLCCQDHFAEIANMRSNIFMLESPLLLPGGNYAGVVLILFCLCPCTELTNILFIITSSIYYKRNVINTKSDISVISLYLILSSAVYH